MADKDLIEIIARVTAKTVTEVSEIYRREHSGSTRPPKNTAENESFGGVPFGTPFHDFTGSIGDTVSLAKRIEFRTREHLSGKNVGHTT